ncbi:MAG: hypothetical protein M3O30_17495 [Planctomycetota bacterium]|nr:hypothetical protein [Planctomycetota bacterium]
MSDELSAIIDAIYSGTVGENRTEAERRLHREDIGQFRRLIRCGKIIARPEDFPEIPAEDWHRGTITMRRWGHGLKVGDDVCVDRENFARVYRIDSVAEITIEDDDDRPRKATRIEVSEIQINGDYAVLPGSDTRDIASDIIRMKSHALKKI